MAYNRDLTEDELELLRTAGAADDFVVFVDVFPQSTAGQAVLGWFENEILTGENAAHGKPCSGGHFFDMLWGGDTETAFLYADSMNQRHLKTLFGDPVRNKLEAV